MRRGLSASVFLGLRAFEEEVAAAEAEVEVEAESEDKGECEDGAEALMAEAFKLEAVAGSEGETLLVMRDCDEGERVEAPAALLIASCWIGVAPFAAAVSLGSDDTEGGRLRAGGEMGRVRLGSLAFSFEDDAATVDVLAAVPRRVVWATLVWAVSWSAVVVFCRFLGPPSSDPELSSAG